MRVRNCKVALRRLLKQSGFDFSNPDPQQAWEAFKFFAQEPVEANRGYTLADDILLFQCGFMTIYDLKAGIPLPAIGEEYYLEFDRQFTMNDKAGDYSHMEQLHCQFTCPPSDELRAAHTAKHVGQQSNEYFPPKAFFTAVEAMQEFQAAIKQQGYVMTIFQEDPC
jgi:hypothetical protein